MQPRSIVMAVLTAVLLLCTGSHHTDQAEQPRVEAAKTSQTSVAKLASRGSGMKLADVKHRIQTGDTLYDIAVRYQTKIEHILHQNPRLDPNNLTVGQVLNVPVNTLPKKKTREELAQTAEKMVLSASGEPSRYIKMIPCQLTAYTNSYESTGKYPGMPGYGITASGQAAKEGWTIAVDPNVIPIHSIVYIPGIGVRYAEDTGGAVKGNHIDIFYNDDNFATDFGVKEAVRVYLLEEGLRESS